MMSVCLFSNIIWVLIILRNVHVPCSLLGRPGSRFKRVEIYAIRCRSTVQNLKSLLLFTWNWIIDPARIMYCGYCNCRFSSCVVWVPRFWSQPLKNHNLWENLLKKISSIHLTMYYFFVLLTLRCGLKIPFSGYLKYSSNFLLSFSYTASKIL